MNDVREFSVPHAQLSCLIGNLFDELDPPCSEPDDPEALTLYGRTSSGREAVHLQGALPVCGRPGGPGYSTERAVPWEVRAWRIRNTS